MKSKKKLYKNTFSHIYIEEKAFNYKSTNEILKKFKQSKIIRINNYKEIFSLKNQSFNKQKLSQNLILAVKNENLIYKGSDYCQNFDNENFYYTNSIYNCLFDCKYCYLQGMYDSANIVMFVNLEDYFKKLDEITKDKKIYLSISYDTDLMSFENIYPFVDKWIKYVQDNDKIKIEIRTKSINIKNLINIIPNDRIIIGWTLSPEEIIKKYEKKTPNLQNRLNAIKTLQTKGYDIRISIDPILKVDNFEEIYKNFIKQVSENLDLNKISDISLGVFRMPKDFLKKIRKFSDSDIIYYPYINEKNEKTYDKKDKEEMIKKIQHYLFLCNFKNKIYIR
ncbi:MAG: hypothetical protein PWP28_1137 [Oceanotoga sp.]|uniref:SPL family radical SAM protein n=1 Tax=Oceanotoga sp. TaxID=2108366 RepID=UPI002655B298|nr:radical SAM protein [Oceanotoga sp.]MDN5342262.1 hypothetical protein [Oceanotoga sp.]